MVALHKCFTYAKSQFLSMQFQEFSFSSGSKDFYWSADPKVVAHILRKLAKGKEDLAFEIFKEHIVRV